MKASSGKSAVFLWVSLLSVWNSEQSCHRETHTLRYELTALSPEDSWQPLYPILVYVDDELFLCYKGDSRKAEACGPRIKGHAGPETWTRETEELQKKEEQLRRMLTKVMTQQGHNEGSHTLQETLGCELQGNWSTGSFWRFGYDGQDFLTFDQKTPTWTVAVPSSQRMVWETHAPRADRVKTFLEDTCPAQLQGYLSFLRKVSMDTGTNHQQAWFPAPRGTFLWPNGSFRDTCGGLVLTGVYKCGTVYGGAWKLGCRFSPRATAGPLGWEKRELPDVAWILHQTPADGAKGSISLSASFSGMFWVQTEREKARYEQLGLDSKKESCLLGQN